MNSNQFKEICDAQFEYCLEVLGVKANEYVISTDRLKFIKDGALLLRCNNKEAVYALMSKHLISIRDMCQQDSQNYTKWLEKITDTINYLLLLKAVIYEESTEVQL